MEKKGIVTKFYSPGCGHCVALKPDWDRLKEKYGDMIQEVNCVENGEECGKAQIQGVPTIRYEMKDTNFDHVGERTFASIEKNIAALGFKKFQVKENWWDKLEKFLWNTNTNDNRAKALRELE
jgi:thiol-disulfide isomerase/thioredoxin